MMKLLRQSSLSFLVIFLLFFSLFIKTEAFSVDLNPVPFLYKTTDLVIDRLSNFVYYLLMMQKKYLKVTVLTNESFSTPGPVVKSNLKEKKYVDYVKPQILSFTNQERLKVSLEPLSSNPILDYLANLRVNDLFANQYFEHISPSGQSVATLAQKNNYEYILIGENLALGNFGSDQQIVSAWMESNGHKANILNEKYTELGVAVKEGIFNGEKVIIAVQIFGRPLSVCPKPSLPNESLTDNSIKSIKKVIDLYNQEVNKYNSCLNSQSL